MRQTDYAAAVAAILAHAGQTAYQMAKTIGLTQQAILDVTKGNRLNPRADTLDRLLRGAKLDWSFLNRFRVNDEVRIPPPPAADPEVTPIKKKSDLTKGKRKAKS